MNSSFERLQEAAMKLNEAAVRFASRKSKKPLTDGSALGLEHAALVYAVAVQELLGRKPKIPR